MADANQIDPRKLRAYVILGIIVIAFIIFIKSTFIIIQPTERGVVFKKYTTGLDVDNIRGEGLNIIAPWNDIIKFNVEEQTLEETMDVLSQDGLSINIDVSVRFNPIPSEIGKLYLKFKNDYTNKLVRQELRSAVRRIIGEYTPEELYSTKRREIETEIEIATRKVLLENNVALHALLFRSIKLPDTIKKSIEEKLKADQEAQKQKYLIAKARLEADQRKIEAEGKAVANRILNASLSDNILKEKGIQATEELAKSPNSKIIIIGGGKDGLPIILNSDN